MENDQRIWSWKVSSIQELHDLNWNPCSKVQQICLFHHVEISQTMGLLVQGWVLGTIEGPQKLWNMNIALRWFCNV
jgi:hypothetical protein